MKLFFPFLLMAVLISGGPAKAAALRDAPSVNFALDCMIHDAHGVMLKNLGTLGLLSDGTYVTYARFPYNGIQVEAEIQGPTLYTPEVSSPVQLAMRFVMTTNGNQITAAVVTDLTEDRSIALWEPTLNVYLHCAKMGAR